MKNNQGIRRSTAVLLYLFIFVFFVFFLCRPVHAQDEMPDNGIPVVTIEIDESQGSIEEMLKSPDHSVYCYGTITIRVPEGFHYSDYPDLDLKNYDHLKMSVRGRGNSTWNQKDKKPFKVKLDKKEDIFGFGKNKHWVLLANAFDPSLIRNRITYWLSERLGFDFTPQGVPVDLVMSGEQFGTKYLGSYYLAENIRIDDNRLEIGELEEDDTEMPMISGGYLIQNALQVEEGSANRFNTTRGEPWATDTPNFEPREGGYENEAQKTYIRNHLNAVEDAIFAGDESYRELLDVESAASYWLMNTMAMNLDAYKTSSTYIYKKRDENGITGKVYWGPVWDFDYAWDQGETYEGMSAGHTWMKPLFTDRTEGGFIEEVRKQWPSFRENVISVIEEGGLLDQYYAETKLSAEADHIINPDGEDTGSEYSYKEKVENLRTWITNRLAWLDANIGTIDEMVHTVTYYVEGEEAAKDYFETTETLFILPLEPAKEGCIFMGWEDQDGNPVEFDISGDHDIQLYAKFIDESEAVQANDIVFAKPYDAVRYNPEQNVYMLDWLVLPHDAYDKWVDFFSSDESVASVTEDGQVNIHGPGTVTITVKLRNGISRDFVLTITEDEVPLPETIIPETDVIHLCTGETANLLMNTEPAIAKVDEYVYESENADIADVNSYGVITAMAPGTVRIHISANTADGEETHTCEGWVTVIVSDTPFVPEYTVVSEENPQWRKDQKDELIITVKRNEEDDTCIMHFETVQIDAAELIRDTDYTAKAGSTIIRLRPAYLKQLDAGEHTLRVIFDDGKAETVFTILEAENEPASDKPSSPDTSDHSSAWLWISAMMISLLVSGICIRRKLAG